MEILKNPRFWLAMGAMGVVAGLAFLDKVSGETAVGSIAGIVGGFGIAAAKIEKTAGTIKGLLVLGALGGLLYGATGCMTTPAGDKAFDQCQALRIAHGSHTVAEGAAAIVCNSLPAAKRAKCLAEAKKYSGIGSAILQLGAGVLKACKIGS